MLLRVYVHTYISNFLLNFITYGLEFIFHTALRKFLICQQYLSTFREKRGLQSDKRVRNGAMIFCLTLATLECENVWKFQANIFVGKFR